jgi:dsDNA-specific endonuclease/ATPase MutS2
MPERDKDLWAMAAENLSRLAIIPQLDLHGLAVFQALPLLESFLNSQFMAGEEVVKVICGIGTGKLMTGVKSILIDYKSQGLVEDFIQVKSGGVFIVRLVEKN